MKLVRSRQVRHAVQCDGSPHQAILKGRTVKPQGDAYCRRHGDVGGSCDIFGCQTYKSPSLLFYGGCVRGTAYDPINKGDWVVGVPTGDSVYPYAYEIMSDAEFQERYDMAPNALSASTGGGE